LFESKGAKVDYHDPFCPQAPHMREYPQYEGIVSTPIERAGDYDVVLISTAHDGVDYARLAKDAKLIIDTRNAMPAGDNIFKA
jgi:UDP-N-acetyl-D-glucosamine dehydrogenase